MALSLKQELKALIETTAESLIKANKEFELEEDVREHIGVLLYVVPLGDRLRDNLKNISPKKLGLPVRDSKHYCNCDPAKRLSDRWTAIEKGFIDAVYLSLHRQGYKYE